jgi:sec-independent protein translocase protein TatA
MFEQRLLAMFGIGMSELLIIMVIVLIIFGAGKLPEIGGALGKGIRNFKTGVTGNESEDKAHQSTIESPQDQKKLE